jgi:hypothetical protein
MGDRMSGTIETFVMPANPIGWALESYPADRPELVAKAAGCTVQDVIDYLAKEKSE